MATYPVHGLENWDDDLFTWLSVAHNSDGTLVEIPTSVPITYTYIATTDNTTVTVYDSAGAEVDSGTDLGAIFNSLVGARQAWRFGPGDFPITTTLSIPDENHIGITLEGSGGLGNMNIQSVTLQPAVTRFKYTPASGTLLDVNKAQGVTCRDIHFHATSGSYTGSLLDFRGDYTTSPRKVTRHSRIDNCTLQTRKGDTTGALLEVSTCVDFLVTGCLFEGGRWNVRGMTDATSVGDGEPSDEVHFRGSRFQYYQETYGAIANAGRAWSFSGCTFEPSTNGGVAKFLTNDVGVPGAGVSFYDTYASDYSDPGSGNDSLFTYNGFGLSIRGGWFAMGSGQHLVYINEDTTGLNISGLYFEGTPDVSLIDVGSGKLCNDVVVEGIDFTSATVPLITGTVTRPPDFNLIPYRSLSADTTLTHNDHNRTFGVDASGGAKTITLPAASCVGFTVTVKKSDSSGNAVTVSRASSATIEGSTTVSLGSQYSWVRLIADGTNWKKIGSS